MNKFASVIIVASAIGLLSSFLGGCSQAGNNMNSFGVVWVGPGTSATLTINAQTVTTPVEKVVAVPVKVLP